MKVMFANDIESQQRDDSKTAVREKKKKFRLNNFFFAFFGGGMLSSDRFLKWFPFLIYLVFLGILYITNTFIAEDMSAEIVKTKELIQVYHYEYSANASRIVELSKRTSLGERLASKGIADSEESVRVFVNEYFDDIIGKE